MQNKNQKTKIKKQKKTSSLHNNTLGFGLNVSSKTDAEEANKIK